MVGIYRWRHINDVWCHCNIQSFPTFGRVYAYGGVFIVMSLIWAYIVDKQAPDKYDLIGACICIICMRYDITEQNLIKLFKRET